MLTPIYLTVANNEVLFAYFAIFFSIPVGLVLWHYHVKNLGLLQNTILILGLGFLADVSYKHSMLAQAKSKRAHRLAQRAARLAQEEKAEAQAQTARLATACEGLQVAVAETVAEKERASEEAARESAKAARVGAEAERASAEAARASAEAARLFHANQGLKAVVAKNESAINYQVEFTNKLQEEQARERERLKQIAQNLIAEGNIAELGRLMFRIISPKHPHYSVRLSACIEMWAYFEETDLTNASAQDALYAWAWEHAEKLGLMHNGDKSKTAVAHCAYVANWDYIGGAPKSEAKIIGIKSAES